MILAVLLAYLNLYLIGGTVASSTLTNEGQKEWTSGLPYFLGGSPSNEQVSLDDNRVFRED